MSVLSSYLQHEVPLDFGFCGEVDLRGGIRSNFEPVKVSASGGVTSGQGHYEFEDQDELEFSGSEPLSILPPEFLMGLNGMRKIFVPGEVRDEVAEYLEVLGVSSEVVGVELLQDLLPVLWPDVV